MPASLSPVLQHDLSHMFNLSFSTWSTFLAFGLIRNIRHRFSGRFECTRLDVGAPWQTRFSCLSPSLSWISLFSSRLLNVSSSLSSSSWLSSPSSSSTLPRSLSFTFMSELIHHRDFGRVLRYASEYGLRPNNCIIIYWRFSVLNHQKSNIRLALTFILPLLRAQTNPFSHRIFAYHQRLKNSSHSIPRRVRIPKFSWVTGYPVLLPDKTSNLERHPSSMVFCYSVKWDDINEKHYATHREMNKILNEKAGNQKQTISRSRIRIFVKSMTESLVKIGYTNCFLLYRLPYFCESCIHQLWRRV